MGVQAEASRAIEWFRFLFLFFLSLSAFFLLEGENTRSRASTAIVNNNKNALGCYYSKANQFKFYL